MLALLLDMESAMEFPSLYFALPNVNSIRLLQLQAGSVDEAVDCSLLIVPELASAPVYRALSYCWGDADNTTELICNGKSIHVTKGLHAALQRLRRGKDQGSIMIWADALCINQNDVGERNQQLLIMPQVYKHAACIEIWVGPGDKNSSSALDLIYTIGHGCCSSLYGFEDHGYSWKAKLCSEQDRAQVLRKLRKVEILNATSVDWKPFWEFYQAPWFSRVWVIQEVQQCPNIRLLCGERAIEWHFVALAASWARYASWRHPEVHWKKNYFPSYLGFNNAYFMWEQASHTRNEAPFLIALYRAANFKSTDPRDKVFAMLEYPIYQQMTSIDNSLSRSYGTIGVSLLAYPALAGLSYNQSHRRDRGSSKHLAICPDYHMSILEVFRHVAFQSIRQYKNLEVLRYSWQTVSTESTWPTWVPRWDKHVEEGPELLLPFLYQASLTATPIVKSGPASDVLIVRGINIGSIKEVTSVLGYERLVGMQQQTPKVMKNVLLTMSRLIVQDRWQEDAGDENSAQRSEEAMRCNFADFAAYLMHILEGNKSDCYVSLSWRWCDYCQGYIHDKHRPVTTLPMSYMCQEYDCSHIDICTNCFERGQRCKSIKHVLSKNSAALLGLPYSKEVMSVLRTHAVTGNIGRYIDTTNMCMRSRTFFYTSDGSVGVAVRTVEPEDILVVLFGSRVPFVLRRSGTSYRLVSDCFFLGYMDGEAIQMLKDGKIEAEDFEIR
jgi:hypothetical protein